MKVYVVHGCLRNGIECDSTIYSVFDSCEKAVDYAIEKSRDAFDKQNVKPEYREFDSYGIKESDSQQCVCAIMDIVNFDVILYVDRCDVH